MSKLYYDIFLAFVRVHLLHHAAEEPFYGAAMLEELQRHGYRLSPGTLYPILHGLEKAGYLSVEQAVVGGKARKYYRITDQGRTALKGVKPKLRELVEEVLGDLGPAGRSDPSE
ncbi:PadR family transcriptional regulator [Methylocaldum gracile subsp. desertum]|uniref:PadR family transcriptional regulator n=1 Tax=Methylocaldum sp. GT1BW TaxID=3438964 RepID=UPI003DA0035D